MSTPKILLALLLAAPSLDAQDRLFVSVNPAAYLYNSENSFKTIENGSLGWAPGFSIGFERDSLWGMTMLAEYCYTRSIADNAMRFDYTISPPTVLSFGADLIYVSHSLDIGIRFRISKYFLLAVGPTVSLSHRTITLTEPRVNEISARDFEDRLVSIALGANGSASFEIPFQDSPPSFFAFTTLKLRFLHAIWFDKRGRNLDDYYQTSLLSHLGLGVGYAF